MKKLYIFILGFFFLYWSLNAAWYENDSWSNWGATTWVRNCVTDGDNWDDWTDAIRVANNNGASTLTPEWSSKYARGTTWTLRCLYWDNTNPNNLSNASTYTNGWVNQNQTITARWRDTGGSRLKRITLQQSTNGGAYSTLQSWDNLTAANNTLVSRTRTRSVSGQNGNTFRYRVVTEDYAGNTRTITNSATLLRIDTQDPANTTPVYTAWGSAYTPGTWSNQDVTVEITCTDPLSGCDMYNQGGFTYSWNTYSRTFWNTTGSAGSVSLRDNAAGSTRNTRSISYGTVRVDKTTPGDTNITVVSPDDHIHDEWNDDRSINLTASLDNSWAVSPRSNYYCMDTVPFGADCDPYDGGAGSTSEPDTSNLSDGEYHWRAQTCTSAWNCSAVDTFIIKIDDTTPTNLDILAPAIPRILANHDYPINLQVSRNGWSPIVEIRWRFENWNSQNGFLWTIDSDLEWTLSNTVSTATWTTNQNLCNISNNSATQNNTNCNVTNGWWSSLNTTTWWRDYRFRITYVRDEAGNIFTTSRDLNYEVYANTVDIDTPEGTAIVDASIISRATGRAIADTSSKDVVITLRDNYGNAVIDAPGISREVGINMNINNSITLNQLVNPLWFDSAVTIWAAIIPNGFLGYNAWNTPWVVESNNGEYTLPFYVYAPSNYDLTPGTGTIQLLQYNISWWLGITWETTIGWDISGWTNIPINIDPIYTTDFNEKLDGTSTFIEWVEQSSSLRIENLGASVGNNKRVFLQFGWAELSTLSLTWSSLEPIDTRDISEYGSSLDSIFRRDLAFPSSWNNTAYLSFETTLSSSTFPMTNISDAWLASIVQYDIPWIGTIRYPADMINKDRYHDLGVTWNAAQVSIRIIWNTNSDTTQAITEDASWNNEFDRDIRLLWKLTKSSFRKDIEERIYRVIRNIPAKLNTDYDVSPTDLSSVTWSNPVFGKTWSSRWEAVFWNAILYFWNMSWVSSPVEIALWGVNNIEGNKTIIVEDWDAYINWNIGNSDGDGTLAIVVLNGDILIDDEVTDVHAILYTNQSILSSTDWSDRLNGNAPSWSLQNQLYIKWSLFSENTIWWSRISPDPACPYYVQSLDCVTQQQAQAYDLNYLRRYFTYDSGSWYDVDTTWDSVYDKNRSWAISQAAISNYEFAEFPVIVDYNPLLQSSPPPFFD